MSRAGAPAAATRDTRNPRHWLYRAEAARGRVCTCATARKERGTHYGC